MRLLILFLLLSVSGFCQQHCGYDFTSYIVLHVHEDGKKENIPGLKITLADSLGNPVINTGNKLSWKNKDELLLFSENFKIDDAGNKLPATAVENYKWYFPFSKDTYLLSVTNEFAADQFTVRIEDPKNIYKPQTVQLFAYNMYVLCTTQAAQQAVQFGRRVNRPVDIVLAKQ